jgi:hypothetical protein
MVARHDGVMDMEDSSSVTLLATLQKVDEESMDGWMDGWLGTQFLISSYERQNVY